jgi:hypothetical protein
MKASRLDIVVVTVPHAVGKMTMTSIRGGERKHLLQTLRGAFLVESSMKKST